MFKIKIEKINYQMIIENTFCDYLNQKAQEGLIFKQIFGDYIIFNKKEH